MLYGRDCVSEFVITEIFASETESGRKAQFQKIVDEYLKKEIIKRSDSQVCENISGTA